MLLVELNSSPTRLILTSSSLGPGDPKRFKIAKGILARDNFVFLGAGHCLLYSEFVQRQQGLEALILTYPNYTNFAEGAAGWFKPAFVEKVQKLRSLGVNAMVVYEDLGSLTPPQIQGLADLLTPHWDVKVLVAYRPLYSWLLSLQNQFNKKRMPEAWPGSPSSDHHIPFDLDNHRAISWILLHAMETYGKHPTELVRDNFKQSFNSVEVIPLHLLPPKWGQGDPLLGHIFCQALKSLTPHACRQVEAGVLGQNATSNPSEPLDYNILADRAYEKDLIPRASGRPAVIARIRHEFESNKNLSLSDLPQKCTSNEAIERFERLSLKVERRLFADTTNETAHHAGFAKMLAKKSHCHMDADKTLEQVDTTWTAFFKQQNDLVGTN
jgi:hypothetical protein